MELAACGPGRAGAEGQRLGPELHEANASIEPLVQDAARIQSAGLCEVDVEDGVEARQHRCYWTGIAGSPNGSVGAIAPDLCQTTPDWLTANARVGPCPDASSIGTAVA